MIEDALYYEPPLLEVHVVGQCLPQIAGTYKDKVMLLIQTQDISYLIIQFFNVITVSLLAETAEIV